MKDEFIEFLDKFIQMDNHKFEELIQNHQPSEISDFLLDTEAINSVITPKFGCMVEDEIHYSKADDSGAGGSILYFPEKDINSEYPIDTDLQRLTVFNASVNYCREQAESPWTATCC